ncbi:hypothetical protein C7E18_07695, partial [Stenotrophomonas maltophilia]
MPSSIVASSSACSSICRPRLARHRHRRRGSQTLVFVSAVQDRYALKKSPTSASVGVGALG